jgi:hypothetical protein
MKSEIFSNAIYNRNAIKFLYQLCEVTIDPYFISQNKSGKKYIYGKAYSSSQIKKFEFNQIVNIRVLRKQRFSPIIPIIAQMN